MVSVVIVHFHVKKLLFECIGSIVASSPKSKYEVIVVDNDEVKTIGEELKRKFPGVKYIPHENKGYGEGNNVGARAAKGEYLYFLNPDTKFVNNSIDTLVNYLEKNKDVAVAAPLLFDREVKPYKLQGIRELNPFRAIFALSFVNKLFPENKVYRDYYFYDWDKKSVREVDAVPGTAFVIRINVFEKIRGFDERFFLFFEEFDLCKRVKELGWKIIIDPSGKVLHYWGESTKKRDNIEQIFLSSRFYYFKKHYGIIRGIFTEMFLRINKYTLFLVLIAGIALFLRLYKIGTTMPFISEQGWFYLSARDMVLNGKIPLVGIASSHPWLHQGALWTYMMAGAFAFFGFDPLNGAYLSVFLDFLAVFLIYFVGKSIFSDKVGVIASLLYATSPAVITNARMPYHTSPIPLFTILFIYLLFGWVGGKKYFFPFIIGCLAVLYNLELATFPFTAIFLTVFIFGFWKKKDWARGLINIKSIIYSFVIFTLVMLPMILYDAGHKFPQTIGFIMWLGYRVLVLFGYPQLHPDIQSASLNAFFVFSINEFRNVVFAQNLYIALAVIAFGVVALGRDVIKQISSKSAKVNYILFSIVFLLPIMGYIVGRIPSGAYVPMLLPGFILLISYSIAKIKFKNLAYIMVILISGCNIWYFINWVNNNGDTYSEGVNMAKEIILQSDGKAYNLDGRFVDNYRYLTWWLGKGESGKNELIHFSVEQENDKLKFKKIIKL